MLEKYLKNDKKIVFEQIAFETVYFSVFDRVKLEIVRCLESKKKKEKMQ